MEMKVSLSEDKRHLVFETDDDEECRLGLQDAMEFLATIQAIVGEMKAALEEVS